PGQTPKVYREELDAGEADDATGLDVRLQRHGARDVELEGQRKGDQLADDKAVHRRPGLDLLQRERRVLGWQRALRLHPAVDAFRIRVERRARLSRGCVVGTLRRAPQADRAQLDIARERRR